MFDRQAKKAFIIAIIVLVGSQLGISSVQKWMGVFLHKESVSMRQDFSRIPKRLGGWESTVPDRLMDEAELESLGTRMYLSRTYDVSEKASPDINVHVAYYTGLIDAVPHVPDRCLVAGGLTKVAPAKNLPLTLRQDDWIVHEDRINQATNQPYRTMEARHPFTNERIEVTMPIGEFQWRTTEFTDQRNKGLKIFAGYMFVANGRVTPSPDGVRIMAFDLFEPYAYYCKIQLTVLTKSDFKEEDFAELSAEFLDEFLPELMRCLPDWWEHESATSSTE